VTIAREVVATIGDRFRDGDPAAELLTQLNALVATIQRQVAQAGNLPEDLQAAIAGLLNELQATTMVGDGWLDANAGPELAEFHMRSRINKAYGVPIRDD
jgi:hypothetical protein